MMSAPPQGSQHAPLPSGQTGAPDHHGGNDLQLVEFAGVGPTSLEA